MFSVLIVDDSAMIRRGLRSTIEANQALYVCGEAENGKVAVEKVNELRPDTAILDLQMPVMNGLEAARQISKICSGHGDVDLHNALLRPALAGCSRRGYSRGLLKR